MAKNRKDKARFTAAKSPNSKTRSGCSFRPTLGSADDSLQTGSCSVPQAVPAHPPSGSEMSSIGSKSPVVSDLPSSNPLATLIQDIESSPSPHEIVPEPLTSKSPISSLLGSAHHRWCDAAAIYDMGFQSVDSIVVVDIGEEGGIDAHDIADKIPNSDIGDIGDSIHPCNSVKSPSVDIQPIAATVLLDGMISNRESGCVTDLRNSGDVSNAPITADLIAPLIQNPSPMIDASHLQVNGKYDDLNSAPRINSPVSAEVNTQIPSSMLDVPPFQVNGKVPDHITAPKVANSLARSPLNKPADNPLPNKWSSLFSTLPKNAGNYIPTMFTTSQIDGVFIPPIEVVTAGTKHWEQHLVGFFLDVTAPYGVVRDKCKSVWNVKGSLQVQFFNSMFYFKFSNNQDKLNALEKSPLIIDGKPFIITPWSQDVDKARERVMSIPVWATFTHIPSILQPLVGLNWLASLIGDLKCFDTNTVERKSLHYARALIEITPSMPLPSKLPVRLSEGNYVEVDVNYKWKPDICSSCCSFGHLPDSCPAVTSPPAVKVPLTKPSFSWVPKPKPPPVHVDLEEDATPKSPLASDTDSDRDIYWSSVEQAWVHEDTEMRYEPATESFYKYVGEEGEERCLYYQAVDGDIVLCDSGELAESNSSLLEDVTWDRKYMYGPDSSDFTPTLYSLFLSYLHVLGPDSSEDGNDSSSFEEG